MKILILNGSPKCEKSDTLHMSSAFARGICSAVEAEVQVIHVARQHIEYCVGCFDCKKTGKCIFDDDMQQILDSMLSSNVIIYSFPLYCNNMPAPLKALTDRTMPLSTERISKVDGRYRHESRNRASGTHYVMMCGSGYPYSKEGFECVTNIFRLMFPHRCSFITMPESPLFNIPYADPVAKPRLALFERAGAEYAADFSLSRQTLDALAEPMIPEEIYAKFANGEKPDYQPLM